MVNQTLQCIRESMLSLLKEKEYSKIQMKEIAENAHIGRKTLYRYFYGKEEIIKYIAESLMDRFTAEIKERKELNIQNITHSFFSFVYVNRTEILLLKKARLLSYIEDNIFELMTGVAAKTKYDGKSAEEVKDIQRSAPAQDRYTLYYTMYGNWKMAMVWIDEGCKESIEDVTGIALKIMTGIR